MVKIIKIVIALISVSALVACVAVPKEESKTNRARAAQDRINASKTGADVITKELDHAE